VILGLMLAAALGSAASAAAPAVAAPFACSGAPLAEPVGYYDIELVPTGRVPGTRSATGAATVTSAPSPFGVALTAGGGYRQRLVVRVDGVLPAIQGQLAVWVTTTEVDQVRLLGTLQGGGDVVGEVDWNKFLVVVTLEPSAPEQASTWVGPVALRGASRSGRMHTMAGHGPFEAEPCAKYGY